LSSYLALSSSPGLQGLCSRRLGRRRGRLWLRPRLRGRRRLRMRRRRGRLRRPPVRGGGLRGWGQALEFSWASRALW